MFGHSINARLKLRVVELGFFRLVAATLLVTACNAGSAATETAAASPNASSAQSLPEGPAVSSSLPSNVDAYATADAGAGQQCMVGAATYETGMNEKPVVYLRGPNGFVWNRTLPLPPHTFQARATHCVADANALFVLVQGDTQQEQTLSQTLLVVVELNKADGKVLASHGIDLPKVASAHTTWVEKGEGNFRLQGNSLFIAGRYALLSDRDKRIDFSISVPIGVFRRGR